MKLQLETAGALTVRWWRPGELRIGSDVWREPVLLSPRKVRPWSISEDDPVTLDHLMPLIEEQPDVIILGTGERQRFPEHELGMLLLNRGIGLEVMDTGAACRTYNVLVSEGRAVGAALRHR